QQRGRPEAVPEGRLRPDRPSQGVLYRHPRGRPGHDLPGVPPGPPAVACAVRSVMLKSPAHGRWSPAAARGGMPTQPREVGPMVHIHEDLKRTLAERHEEYRKLLAEHASCETRLQELQSKAALDDTERVETVNIKKQKLQLKDRMERIVREHLEREAGAGVRH